MFGCAKKKKKKRKLDFVCTRVEDSLSESIRNMYLCSAHAWQTAVSSAFDY